MTRCRKTEADGFSERDGGGRSMNSKTVGNTGGYTDRSWNRVQGDGVVSVLSEQTECKEGYSQPLLTCQAKRIKYPEQKRYWLYTLQSTD